MLELNLVCLRVPVEPRIEVLFRPSLYTLLAYIFELKAGLRPLKRVHYTLAA